MAYDTELADRLRELLATQAGVSEKPMFGGLAFLFEGAMTVAASGRGGLMARIDPDRTDELLARPGAAPMIMRGRPARGWLRVDPAPASDAELARWVADALDYVRTLPPER